MLLGASLAHWVGSEQWALMITKWSMHGEARLPWES